MRSYQIQVKQMIRKVSGSERFAKRSVGVVQEPNLGNCTQTRKHTRERSTLALKLMEDVTRSLEQGYQ